jgi:hypothetical protein
LNTDSNALNEFKNGNALAFDDAVSSSVDASFGEETVVKPSQIRPFDMVDEEEDNNKKRRRWMQWIGASMASLHSAREKLANRFVRKSATPAEVDESGTSYAPPNNDRINSENLSKSTKFSELVRSMSKPFVLNPFQALFGINGEISEANKQKLLGGNEAYLAYKVAKGQKGFLSVLAERDKYKIGFDFEALEEDKKQYLYNFTDSLLGEQSSIRYQQEFLLMALANRYQASGDQGQDNNILHPSVLKDRNSKYFGVLPEYAPVIFMDPQSVKLYMDLFEQMPARKKSQMTELKERNPDMYAQYLLDCHTISWTKQAQKGGVKAIMMQYLDRAMEELDASEIPEVKEYFKLGKAMEETPAIKDDSKAFKGYSSEKDLFVKMNNAQAKSKAEEKAGSTHEWDAYIARQQSKNTEAPVDSEASQLLPPTNEHVDMSMGYADEVTDTEVVLTNNDPSNASIMPVETIEPVTETHEPRGVTCSAPFDICKANFDGPYKKPEVEIQQGPSLVEESHKNALNGFPEEFQPRLTIDLNADDSPEDPAAFKTRRDKVKAPDPERIDFGQRKSRITFQPTAKDKALERARREVSQSPLFQSRGRGGLDLGR